MFDEKTILARLQNGEDAKTIADEMAAALNAANKTYVDQKAKAEAEAKRSEIQKQEELQDILDLFADWFGNYYGIDTAEIKEELSAATVIELIDSLKEYIDAIKGLEAMIGKKPTKKIVKPAATADETINSFLKQMGW